MFNQNFKFYGEYPWNGFLFADSFFGGKGAAVIDSIEASDS